MSDHNIEIVNKGGRPSTLTPDVHDRLVNAVAAGNYQEVAIAYAGVVRKTFYEWMKTARNCAERDLEEWTDHEKACVALRDDIARAEAQAEVRGLANISKAGESDWRADAWRLERKSHDRWGRREALEVSGPKGGPVEIVTEDARGELLSRINRISERLRADSDAGGTDGGDD
jgi:hypothetical protein